MARLHIGIVGAGPAGIMAALEAARRGARVTLFDTNATVGRKILVTGNGRCNITNVHAAPDKYACADPEFVRVAFARFGHRETVARLRDVGILIYSTPDGWCYPLSESAANVADILAAALELAGVETRLQTKIADIRPGPRGIGLAIGGGPHVQTFDRVIVACGGKAYPALGSRGDLFPVLESLGHRIVPIRPALAPLTADVKRFHKLQGVRLDVALTLYDGDRVLGRSMGNMMFTEYGFSGPAAMDLAHLVSARPGTYLTLEINLLPYVRAALEELLARKSREPFPVRVLLGAVLPQKIPPLVMAVAGVRPDARLTEITDAERARLMETLTCLKATVTGTRGFTFAQVSTGGVPLAEVDPTTMASRVVPHLYFAGEVLDVVGPCGGYNLQWAWTSGAIAGAGAAGGG